MITFFQLIDQQLKACEQDSDAVVWLNVVDPTPAEIAHLIANYQLPTDYLTGVLDADENSRFEGVNQEHGKIPALLLLQYPQPTASPSGYVQLETLPFAIIFTKQAKIITVIKQEADFLTHALQTALPKTELQTNDRLPLYLAWHVAVCYNRALKELVKRMEKLESELKVSTENSQLYQIMDIQKSLVYFEAAIQSNLSALKTLYHIKGEQEQQLHLPYIHDILVEMQQAETTTKIQLKLVDKISDTFSAIVSNNLNNVMKILTSLTIVLTIPTIIGGIYGMNVKLPFAGREDAFWWIFGITAFLCVFVIHRLKKRHLL